MEQDTSLESCFNKAIGHFEAGDMEQAETVCRDILATAPDYGGAFHLLGVIYYQQGKIEASIDLVKKAISQEPSNFMYYNSLGNLLEETGNLDEAISSYEKALELNPSDTRARAALWSLEPAR